MQLEDLWRAGRFRDIHFLYMIQAISSLKDNLSESVKIGLKKRDTE